MFSIELACAFICESAHFKFANYETALLNSINNFPSVCVGIRLDHCECALSLAFKLLTREEIAILH